MTFIKQDLKQIQLEAARIATGTTKLISIQNLYDETGWEEQETRRKNHKLLLFYKMFSNISPVYLSTLAPAQVQAVSSYGLRNATDIWTTNAHTSQYLNSFLLQLYGTGTVYRTMIKMLIQLILLRNV